MNDTATIQKGYPAFFDVTEPIHKIDENRFMIIFNGLPYGFTKDDESVPKGLWEYVMNLIEENPDIVTPMPEPEPPPELEFELPEPPQYDTHGFILGLMGVDIDE